ncbi:MAG: YggS family pyridoxal phosphate-dependent enzyme [Bacteroidota bacterium]
MSISEKIKQIKAELPKEVTLVAVSKTKSTHLILEAYEAGQRDFGENYVQELFDKNEVLPKDIRWHYIGHLQSNKVKYIAPYVYLIHGVDSLKLLKEINKEAIKNARVINCLLQLYIAKEETKFGLSFSEAENLLNSKEYLELKNVSIKGFMAMASNTNDVEEIKNEFRSINNLKNKFSNFPILSIGMSSDYEIAIKEGSTLVRVGSKIFGTRT